MMKPDQRRLPVSAVGPTVFDATLFLADTKVAEELCMVVDEEFR